MASSSDPVMTSIRDACRRARETFSFSSFVGGEQTGTHLLRIHGYSAMEKKFNHSTCIKSPSFRTGGHTWSVEYYPNGFTNNGHVSVVLTHWGVSYLCPLGNLFFGTGATAACKLDIMTAKEAADFREMLRDKKEDSLYIKCEVRVQKMEKD
ncbi:hypothetical protein QOZ80_8BG0651900 [Eleusine coracana subsp. coracana]|nr:hypothetical protein QOZ80_8BG0651900 [Eleusine coracana subsp. coracana]